MALPFESYRKVLIHASFTPFIFIYLSPLIPLSFKGEGEGGLMKGLRPFKLPLDN